MTIAEACDFISVLPRRLVENCDEWCQLAMADKATDEVIGDIGLCRRSPGDVVEIGFTLAPAAQGRGLATEACRAVIDLLFSFADVAMLNAVIDSRNASASALVQRLGMSLDHSEAADFKGALCSELHFVLLNA